MLEWNVFIENANADKIETYNIFKHRHFVRDCCEAFSNNGAKATTDEAEYNKLVEEIRRSLRYWFWCKCEWEVIISGWPESSKAQKKIDVYTQVMMNFQVFMGYLWMNRDELFEGE